MHTFLHTCITKTKRLKKQQAFLHRYAEYSYASTLPHLSKKNSECVLVIMFRNIDQLVILLAPEAVFNRYSTKLDQLICIK